MERTSGSKDNKDVLVEEKQSYDNTESIQKEDATISLVINLTLIKSCYSSG